ncbi:D-aminoacyl-tRNA deacylase [Saccharospirillum impatiens]|uniref:D-aminoacyl-tRNA deacylase n=1 Tax=Saccharospirillum impatiens TaxID=169438 RepID=UPI000415CE32|nr:D-aminoacyl-tRNA deacylase [Saccharospirillum impatiens]
MKALIQRVTQARVTVDNVTIGAINQGLLVLVGIDPDDAASDIDKMAHRLLNYRVFADTEGRMNLNVQQVEGGVLLVPQFTLSAHTRKGLRPSFKSAASPEQGQQVFTALIEVLQQRYSPVETGQFGANMQVSLTNDGPVTFLLDH